MFLKATACSLKNVWDILKTVYELAEKCISTK